MSAAIMHQSALYDFGDLFIKNQPRAIQPMGGMGIAGGMGGAAWEGHPALARAASAPQQQAQRALAGLLDRLGHRRLERALSEPHAPATSRYKTELCRPFEEAGVCKYGDKCQFAHGLRELRNLQRHPKYKTELCRTFHSVGFCPYGPRCHFVHNAEESRRSSPLSSASPSSAGSVASYMSDGTRSPRSPRSPHSPHSPHSPLSPPAPFVFRTPAPSSPGPDDDRLPIFNQLSSVFGDLVLA